MPHVCPWWGGYFIDNPLRRLLHNPEKIIGPYVRPGMTVMDVGCGMGFCSIAMAKIVGDMRGKHGYSSENRATLLARRISEGRDLPGRADLARLGGWEGRVISADTLRRTKSVRRGSPIDWHSVRGCTVTALPCRSRIAVPVPLFFDPGPLSVVAAAEKKNRAVPMVKTKLACNRVLGALPGKCYSALPARAAKGLPE